MTTFVQACNEQHIGNIAALDSSKLQFELVNWFSPDHPAARSHHKTFGSAKLAARECGGRVEIYDNALRALIWRRAT